jgi:Fic family protein
VAKAQRWFISIHPFTDGNGRTSRFLMEWILNSIGLPPPIVEDMNNDIYETEAQWADEIGKGLLKTVEIAEACARQPQSQGCNVVPENPKN